METLDKIQVFTFCTEKATLRKLRVDFTIKIFAKTESRRRV
jgi:hypothetical protein